MLQDLLVVVVMLLVAVVVAEAAVVEDMLLPSHLWLLYLDQPKLYHH